jgi:hypothetical protein
MATDERTNGPSATRGSLERPERRHSGPHFNVTTSSGRAAQTADRLPNAFVVGPAKTGTTALYHYFRAHPQVYTAPVKETNYMSFSGRVPPLAGPRDQESIGDKSITTLQNYVALWANWRDEPVAIDVSPSYMHYPRAATKIAELCPAAKIVIVLRNPVECSFSMYSMKRRDNLETCLTFREALQQIDQRQAAGWDIGWDYLRSYLVSEAVAQYMKLFPAPQLFIRRYELLKREPERFYAELCAFLQVEPIDVQKANVKVNVAATRRDVLARTGGGRRLMRLIKVASDVLPPSWRRSFRRRILDSPGLELSSADRKMLVEYYRADILRLSELLRWDLAQWLNT